MAPKPIYQFEQREAHQIFAWARCVFWAEVECQQYDAYEPAENEPTFGQSTVLMLQWYAALWVAIEGWRECPLSDEIVDELLTDPAFEQNTKLLRRFRNGVYHYQRDLVNERLLTFLQQREHAITWAFLLHHEFKRVVWEVAHPPGVDPAVQREIADGIHRLVGWLPTDIPEAAPHMAAAQYREVTDMILKSGSRNTKHSRNLMDAVNQLRSAAYEADAGWSQEKRAMIEALKRQSRGSSTDAT